MRLSIYTFIFIMITGTPFTVIYASSTTRQKRALEKVRKWILIVDNFKYKLTKRISY